MSYTAGWKANGGRVSKGERSRGGVFAIDRDPVTSVIVRRSLGEAWDRSSSVRVMQVSRPIESLERTVDSDSPADSIPPPLTYGYLFIAESPETGAFFFRSTTKVYTRLHNTSRKLHKKVTTEVIVHWPIIIIKVAFFSKLQL